MRRYTIEVNGKTFVLDVRALGADTFEVNVEDRQLSVQLVDDSDLPKATISPDMEEALAPGVAPAASAASAASPPAVRAPAPRPAAAPGPTQSGAAVAPAAVPRPPVPNTGVSASRTLGAPMPGVIQGIEVAPGARVKRGDVVLTLDAMKMVNAIRAPRDAVVAEVLAEVGKTVAFGDPLIRFEE